MYDHHQVDVIWICISARWIFCLDTLRTMSMFTSLHVHFLLFCHFENFRYFYCSYIRSTEDISSGYSSAEPVSVALSRTASLTNATKAKTKSIRHNEVSSNLLMVPINYSCSLHSDLVRQLKFFCCFQFPFIFRSLSYPCLEK